MVLLGPFFMKRVGVNTRFLLNDKMEGFGWYTFETISRLVKLHPDISFFFFFDRPYDSKFIFAKNVTPVVLYPPARHPILFKIWYDFVVTRALKKYKIDLFISPDGYVSLRTNVPQLAVIHDLNFEHFPDDLPANASRYLRKYFPLFAAKANHILTVSEFSKNDIITTYGIQQDKITVAYNGAAECFKPVSENLIEQTKKKYTSNHSYFLFVGALHPRKNIKRLLEAFDLFKTKTGSTTKLLIVGEDYYWSNAMKLAWDNLAYRDEVIFTGHLEINELVNVYGAAKGLAFVSYFEGFGIPIVEAMKCACPVIVAQDTACHEIAGDAALLCDPYSVDSICEGLEKLDSDQTLRLQLIGKGLNRAESFSWDTTANQMSKLVTKLSS